MRHIDELTNTAGASGPVEAQKIDALVGLSELITAVAGFKQAALDLLDASQPDI